MKFVSAAEVNNNKELYYIVDIREAYEYDACHINCPNIPMANFIERLNELPMDKNIALLCNSGNRSSALANLLTTENKLNNIYIITGGIVAWKEEVDNSLNL